MSERTSTDSGFRQVLTGDWKKFLRKRSATKRVFVRALEGIYGELKDDLYSQPRVYKSTAFDWKEGPQKFNKKVISPQVCRTAQSIETHIDCFSPSGYGQKHGHMNSAVFFVLKGNGHDVHDGRRFEWEAGDAMIVENACVHRHFSDDPDGETIVLIMKAKPLFLFMHMIFQKTVEKPPRKRVKGYGPYLPPSSL